MNTPGRTHGYYLIALLVLGVGLLVVAVCAMAGIPSDDYWQGTP